MKRLFLIFNGAGVILGTAGVVAMVLYINPAGIETGRFGVVLALLGLILWSIWGFLAFLGYGIRRLLTDRKLERIKVVSQRQGFLLVVFLILNLLLKGALLWNPFSSVIIALTIIMVEYYFLQKEYS